MGVTLIFKKKYSTRIFGNEYSILRRSSVYALIIAPAFIANYFVYFFAARILRPEEFGIFYVVIGISNVLYAASTILNIFFTRLLVSHAHPDEFLKYFIALERLVVYRGGMIAIALTALFLSATIFFGLNVKFIVVIIIADVFMAYLTDLGRIYLQSKRRIISVGIYTLIWMLLRLFLCVAGFKLFETVWAGLLGIIFSSIIVYSAFRVYLIKYNSAGILFSTQMSVKCRGIVIAAVAYTCLIAVSNLDILIGYFVLSGVDLGIYSASSIFPKAIVVVTVPILQVLLPSISIGQINRIWLRMIYKIFSIFLFGMSGITGLIWYFSEQICVGGLGINKCDPSLMKLLLFSAPPIVLLYVLSLICLARKWDGQLFWFIFPIVIFSSISWTFSTSLNQLATYYVGFVVSTLLFFSLIVAVLIISKLPPLFARN